MIVKSWSSGCFQWKIGTCIALTGTLYVDVSKGVLAQIVPDNTLDAESSIIAPNVDIRGIPSDRIDGGATRGANLLHSFQEFNVGEARGVYFANPTGIENILTRVTGSNPSNILGRLGVLGGANLLFLNPKGVIYGPNAQLNIEGSFLTSTASSFTFPSGGEFSATDPQAPPLLAISVPLGLQYGNNPGSVQVQGANLQVNPGKTLALVGGSVSVDGGQLQAPGGQIELGGVARESTVGLTVNSSYIGLSSPISDNVLRSDVFLDNGTILDVSAGGDGNLTINAQNLKMARASGLRAGASWLVSSNNNPGIIEINATGAINLTENSFIENLVFYGAMGKGGDISITADSLTVNSSAQLRTDSFGKGDAGNLNIIARDYVTFNGLDSRAESVIAAEAEGQGGTINITTPSLSISGGATLVSHTIGQGNAGDVTINATESVYLEGASTGIGSQVFEQAVGNGGNISIITGNLSASDGATLVTNTDGQGNAGDVTISANDTVSLQGVGIDTQVTGIGSQVLPRAEGNGGKINITAKSLTMANGARLIASSSGQGNGGDVNIITRDTVSFDGVGSNGKSSGVFSSVEVGSVGEGGDISITTDTLNISNGGVLDSQTQTNFKAGALRLSATQSVTINQASLLAQSTDQSNGAGAAGNVTIDTGNLTARNGTVTTSSQQSSGGVITITASKIRLFGDSDITTNVNSGAGGGGNIYLKADSILAFDDSDILSFAREGGGGDVMLKTPAFFGENYRLAARNINPDNLDNNNRVDIDASGAVRGVITTPDVSFIQNGLTNLPENQINTDSLLASSCIVRRNQPTRGSFTVTGTGGLPQRPGDAQMSSFPTVDVATLPSDATTSTPSPNRAWQKGDPIVEPQGLYRLANGKLVLSRECS